ncbi:hypothetical protein J4732_05705 [Serratia marcescens]|uniref:Uncharacterized protein n=1 Tax=Serratia marcescens TaxID=615 RepID=A0A939NKM5_SERMA|nr:hypothetical protein [Serratia marcescens]
MVTPQWGQHRRRTGTLSQTTQSSSWRSRTRRKETSCTTGTRRSQRRQQGMTAASGWSWISRGWQKDARRN